jgi:hypothetical protein
MGNVGSQATIETAQTTLRVMNIVSGSIFFTAAGGVFQIAGTTDIRHCDADSSDHDHGHWRWHIQQL